MVAEYYIFVGNFLSVSGPWKRNIKIRVCKEALITTPFIARGNAVNAEVSHFITPEVLSDAHLWFKLKAHGLEVHLIFKECPNSPSLRAAKATSQLSPLCSLYAQSIQLSAAAPLLIHGCVFSQKHSINSGLLSTPLRIGSVIEDSPRVRQKR